MLATATLLSVLCLLLSGYWDQSHSQANASGPAVQLAVKPRR
jgi:hypothetical protein